MTKLDSHRISERHSATKKKNPSPIVIRPKKASQAINLNESDDSSVERKTLRSTAKLPIKSFNTLDRRQENTQESNFQHFGFPRKGDLSSEAQPAQERSDDNQRKIEVPVTNFDVRTQIPEKSPTTKAPESCPKADKNAPGQFNLTIADKKEKPACDSRRNSLAPGDALTPANSSQKKDVSRKSMHALATQNAANSQHLRNQSRSSSRKEQDQKDNSILSAASARSGKQDSIKGLINNQANNHNLIQKGSAQMIPADFKTTQKPPDGSLRKNSANHSQHLQSEDSSLY